MLWYIIYIVFVHSYQSFGAPVNGSVSLKNLFIKLQNNCSNSFLANQISSYGDICSDLSSPHGEKQLQCLMFYDINSQLCDAIADGKITLDGDYSAKITEQEDVNTLCLGTADWNFKNLTEFPHYKQAIAKIFQHTIPCAKLCGVEDILSDEANHFCKYFKWGSSVLKTKVILPSEKNNTNTNNANLYPHSSLNPEVQPVEVPNNDMEDLQIKDTTKSSKVAQTLNINQTKIEQAKTEPSKTETSSALSQKQLADPVNPTNSENVNKKDITGDKVEDSVVIPELPSNPEEDKLNVESSEPQISNKEIPNAKPLETGPNKDAEDPLKPDVDKEIQLLNHELDRKEPVLENPKVKQPSDMDDYQDSEEGKEGLGDTQGGDDGDDPLLDEVNNKIEEAKNNVKKVETVVSTYNEEREYYPNPMQDGFTEDGDHFFPFFLTAIILVVLLYVLYHNKNKVGKVFFGLILEGRQSSRRRNSRGHSYRRLDTLEQAMSANTAAPPSKIIY